MVTQASTDPRYQHLNNILRAQFAAASLRSAVDEYDVEALKWFEVLRAGSLTELLLPFGGCRNLSEHLAKQLGGSLPVTLVRLRPVLENGMIIAAFIQGILTAGELNHVCM